MYIHYLYTYIKIAYIIIIIKLYIYIYIHSSPPQKKENMEPFFLLPWIPGNTSTVDLKSLPNGSIPSPLYHQVTRPSTGSQNSIERDKTWIAPKHAAFRPSKGVPKGCVSIHHWLGPGSNWQPLEGAGRI